MKPIGGRSLALIPGVMATHSAVFFRVFLEFGARTTAIKLNTADEGILVFAPIPWGPEMKDFLQVLEPGKNLADINVKYLVAPDCEHHMGLKSWKEQFPNAKILAPDPLSARKRKEGLIVDYAFTKDVSSQLLTAESPAISDGTLPIPGEVTNEFDFVYLPATTNKELIVLHKPTKTLLCADFIFNLPAHEQYKGSGISPTSGFSFIAKFLGIDSWLQRKTIGSSLPKSDGVAINAMYDWHFERLIMCHGDILEGTDIREKYAALFSKYMKPKA